MAVENSNNYISLQEATKFCNYSQEYLSLRARQGKLKAVKFGRNWVTKREWLEEYLRSVKEYNHQLKKIEGIESPAELERVIKLEKFPGVRPREIPVLRFGFVVALVFILLATGIVFGKDSFLKDFITEGLEITKEIGQMGLMSMRDLQDATLEKVSSYTYILAEVSRSGEEIIKDYFSWFTRQTFGLGQKLVESYSSANKFVEQKLGGLAYQTFGLGQKLGGLGETISQAAETVWQTISRPFQPKVLIVEKLSPETEKKITKLEEIVEKLPETEKKITKLEETVEKLLPETEKKVTELEEKIKKLKKEKPQIIKKEVEVERITKIEPIKEITREVKVFDDKSLKEIRLSLSQQETKLKNLQLAADFGYINFPLVLGPIGGTSVTTLGTITTGVWQASTIQVPYGGTGLTSVPRGYILIGDTSNNLQATSTLFIDSEGRVGIGTTTPAYTLDVRGKGRFTSDLIVGGNMNVAGILTYTADSTSSPALSVKQNGTGDIVQFWDGENLVFKITDGGQLTLTSTSTPQLTVQYDTTKYLTLAVDSSGTTTVTSTGNIILDPASGEIRTNANFVDIGGATVRAVGEKVFRAAASIYRFGMPAETASTSWIRISKDFPSGSSHPLVSQPPVLPGATRVYHLLINYSDDIATTATSSWRIATSSSGATIAEFSLPGLAATTLNENKPHLTEELPIPNDNWHIDVKVPSGKKIRVFNIFLLAYDQINK